MAKLPLRRCVAPGCSALVEPPENRCPRHPAPASRESAADRGAYHRSNGYFYSSVRWRKVRTKFLRFHPICAGYPGHCSDLASVVDHIKPIADGGAKFSWSNLQALCESCHNRKTAVEQAVSMKGGANLSGGDAYLPSVQLKKCGRELEATGGDMNANSANPGAEALKAAKKRLRGRVAELATGWKGESR
jgi:5-methylcytosine-specific restriction protein A